MAHGALSVNRASGAYSFELRDNVDHPDADQSFQNDQLPIEFSYTVTGTGGSSTNTLTVNVNDDAPLAGDVNVMVDEAGGTNIVVVLDRSGSMDDDPGVSGFGERIDLAREAVSQMMDAYEDIGPVNVLVVDFASSAANSGWFSGSDALADANGYLNGLDPSGFTNYEAALDEVQSAFGTPPGADGFRNVTYFLSDGKPNRGGLNGRLEDDDVDAWEDFLTQNDMTSFAVGIGNGISDGDSDLEAVAFPNNAADNPVIVTDESQLIDTLLSTRRPGLRQHLRRCARDDLWCRWRFHRDPRGQRHELRVRPV